MYGPLVVRIVCGFLADILLFLSFNFTSYSKALCIFFTNPLLIPFIAKCLLKDGIKKFDIIALLLGFTGVIMIIQPSQQKSSAGGEPFGINTHMTVSRGSGSIIEKGIETQPTENILDDTGSPLRDILGVLCATAAAFAGALAVVCNKKTADCLHESVVGFYFCLGALLLSPTWLFVHQREVFPEYSWGLAAFLLVMSVLFYLTLFLMQYAMKFLTASLAGVLIYVTIPCGYVLDHFFFGRQFGMLEILGVCIIVSTSVTVALLKGFGLVL